MIQHVTFDTQRQTFPDDFSETPIIISEVITKLNSTIRAHTNTITAGTAVTDSRTPKNKGFELHTRLPDGSARPATDAEIATADFQSKLQHSMTILQSLPDDSSKFQWAEHQRTNVGNKYYENQDYESAIDVYLTCLTVAGVSPSPDPSTKYTIDYLILYMKIMNNLALCTMQLKWYRKTITFCTLAIDQISIALPTLEIAQQANSNSNDDAAIVILEQQMKLHYKRAKAYRLKGEYDLARMDINHIKTELNSYKKNPLMMTNVDATMSDSIASLRSTSLKEEQLLQHAISQGNKNLKQQQIAMKQMLKPSIDCSTAPIKEVDFLLLHDETNGKRIKQLYYDEYSINPKLHRRNSRNFSTLRSGKYCSNNSAQNRSRTSKSTKNLYMYIIGWLCSRIYDLVSFCFRSRTER